MKAVFVAFFVVFLIPVTSAQYCSTDADADCNGMVNITELTDYINIWYGCSSCAPDLLEAITTYYNTACSDDPGCTSLGSFCDGPSLPYRCAANATDGCLDRTNSTACLGGTVCQNGACSSGPCIGITSCSSYTNSLNCTNDICSAASAGICIWNFSSGICQETTQTYTITATAGAGGSISPSGEVSVYPGRDITFIITPNSGYVAADMVINIADMGAISVGAESVYGIHRVQGNGVITVRFLAQANSIPETIYVDGQLAADCTGGNYNIAGRSCTGSDGRAYSSISEASDVAGPGDTVLIRAGSYSKQSGTEVDVLWPKNSGTPQNPIVFRPYPGERAVIGQGASSFPGDTGFSIARGAISLKNVHDIIIEGLTVDYVAGWIYARGVSNITIRNNNFSRSTWNSKGTARFIDSHYNRIINNRFYEADPASPGAADALQIIASNYNLIENNSFDTASHSLMAIRCGNFNVIRNNNFTNPWMSPSGAAEKLIEVYDCRLDRNANYNPSYIYPPQYDNTKYNLFEGNWFGYHPDYQYQTGSRTSAIQFSGQNTIIRNNIFSNPPLASPNPRYPQGTAAGVGIVMRWGGSWTGWTCSGCGGGCCVLSEGIEAGFVYGNRIYNNMFNGYDGSKVTVAADDSMSGYPAYAPMENVQDYYNYLFDHKWIFSDNEFKNNIFYEGNFTPRSGWSQHKNVAGTPTQIMMRGNVNSNIPHFESNDFFATGKFNVQSIPNVTDWLIYNYLYTAPQAKTPAFFNNLLPSRFVANIQQNPGFADPDNEIFLLNNPSSPVIDVGTYLTKTNSTGSGTTMQVSDAGYFYDGYGILGEDGDLIQLEGQTATARITKINYNTNTLTLDRPLSWSANQGVSLAYSGNGPDIGAYESPYSRQCQGTDTSCGVYPSCADCNSLDGCVLTEYRDYYCQNHACTYSSSPGDPRCFVCSPGQVQSCATGLPGICSQGSQTCQPNGIWGSCVQASQPVAEMCNDNLDNDCDGTTDCTDNDCLADAICQAIPPGIPSDFVSYWKMEGNANDLKGANNGLLYGNTLFVNDAQKGNVSGYDGSGDYIGMGTPASLEMGTSDFSISVWTRTGASKLESIVNKGAATLTQAGYWLFYSTDGRLHCSLCDGTTRIYPVSNINFSIQDGGWHHVAVTLDRDGFASFYLDGIPAGTFSIVSFNGRDLDNPAVNFYVSSTGSNSWSGYMDDVIIYSRALTAQEIQSIYNAQKP